MRDVVMSIGSGGLCLNFFSRPDLALQAEYGCATSRKKSNCPIWEVLRLRFARLRVPSPRFLLQLPT